MHLACSRPFFRPGLALLCSLLPLLCPGAIRTTLEAPASAIAGSEPVILSLLLTNDGDSAVTQPVPASLGLVARLGQRADAVTLARSADAPAEVTLAPGAWARIAYSGMLPPGMTGFIVVQDTSGASGAVALQVSAEAAPPTSAAETAGAVAGSASAPAGDASPSGAGAATPGGGEAGAAGSPRRSARDLGLMANEPIYFSVGGGGGRNARFQFSLKYRPFGPGDDTVGGEHWWQDVYLAYTQTSVWDLHSDSKPFYDSSYRPSISYARHDAGSRILGGRFGYAGGFEHESNGQDGDESRSINILFLRPELRWGDLEDKRWQVTFAPKLYYYLDDGENGDIDTWRGYGDYYLSVEWADNLKIATTTRVGSGGHASILVDVSWPFARINDLIPIGWAHGYLHFQFFTGWGETLLDYNRRSDTQFRLGFMLVR
ncbi:outer membrane phospholipase A [Opitutaceae bacterium TAV1]|nr:outer membrane phospholipase A [Opitutaceae bacterium TAV1]